MEKPSGRDGEATIEEVFPDEGPMVVYVVRARGRVLRRAALDREHGMYPIAEAWRAARSTMDDFNAGGARRARALKAAGKEPQSRARGKATCS